MNDMTITDTAVAGPGGAVDFKSLKVFADEAATLFLSGNERNGKLSSLIRAHYQPEALQLLVDRVITRTGAKSSADAKVRGLGTVIAAAVPMLIDSEGKVTKTPATPRLTVSFRIEKTLNMDTGKVIKSLGAIIKVKEAGKSVEANRLFVTSAKNLLLAAHQCDCLVGEARDIVMGLLEAMKAGYVSDTENASLSAVLEGALEGLAAVRPEFALSEDDDASGE